MTNLFSVILSLPLEKLLPLKNNLFQKLIFKQHISLLYVYIIKIDMKAVFLFHYLMFIFNVITNKIRFF